MNWKFWDKRQEQEPLSQGKVERLRKPKSIPEPVGRYLVVQLGKNPDWVLELESVVRKRRDGRTSSYDIRVFDEKSAVAKNVSVKDYTSLDGHPDLILFEGWFDRRSSEVHIDS